MKMINDIVNWLISSGALTALFIFAWKYVKPWLDNKAAHASTEQSKANWQLLETIADTAVTSLVGNKNLTGQEKFVEAKNTVKTLGNQQGIQVSNKAAQTLVQAAYEASALTPTVQVDVSKENTVVNGFQKTTVVEEKKKEEK